MLTSKTAAGIQIPDRRKFLKGLGALGAVGAVSQRSALADSDRYARRFRVFAQGPVTDFSLVWPAPALPPLPPATSIMIRIRFPIDRRDILEWRTYLAPEGAPDDSLAVLTLFYLRVDCIRVSRMPSPNFGLFGQIVENPVVDNPNGSPFGDLTGETAMVSAQFDAPGPDTTFSLLGGAAAGNHASAVREARGSLFIQGSWRSL